MDSGVEENYRRTERRYACGVRVPEYGGRLADLRNHAEVTEDCWTGGDGFYKNNVVDKTYNCYE